MEASMKIVKLTLVMAMLLPILLCFGCGDDKSSNGSDPIPTELVDTWWYESATINGEPVESFSEVSFNGSATSGSVSFTATGTWNSAEYAESVEPIFTQSGTFTVHGDSLDFRGTVMNGTPLDPAREFAMEYEISENDLTLIGTDMIGEVTYIIIINYVRED
jgi:hypothetical protein